MDSPQHWTELWMANRGSPSISNFLNLRDCESYYSLYSCNPIGNVGYTAKWLSRNYFQERRFGPYNWIEIRWLGVILALYKLWWHKTYSNKINYISSFYLGAGIIYSVLWQSSELQSQRTAVWFLECATDLFSPKPPDRFWDPFGFLFIGHHGLFQWRQSSRGMKLIAYRYIVPSLRIRESMASLTLMP